MLLLTARKNPAEELTPAVPVPFANSAMTRLTLGSTVEAARQAQQALQEKPDSPLLQSLAGAIYLQTGAITKAQAAFERALTNAPNDALARYGRGLTRLAKNDRQGAKEDFRQSAQNGGDPTTLQIAREYGQWLEAGHSETTSADTNDITLIMLHGMRLARNGAKKQALTELETVFQSLPADVLKPVTGLRMTFETNRPFAAAPALPAALGPDANLPRTAPVSGDLYLEPQAPPASVAYVSYEIDEQSLGLVNVAPFGYTWDSRHAPNGMHTLCIRCYDRNGIEIIASKRVLRLFNRDGRKAEDEGGDALRSALWQALTLRPDRAALADELGTLARAQGDNAAAARYFWQAAAFQLNYRDTRRKLTELGALNPPDEALYGGLTTKKEIALTFDDGPKPGMTESLLDLLKEQHVPATFFVIGRHVAANPMLARQIAEAGMELANHSYTHRSLAKISPDEVAREMVQTQAAIFAATGKLPHYMRPPGGNWNPKVDRIVRQWGLTPCFWTVDVYNSEVISTQQVADSVISQVRPGAIVLMHNGKMNTLQALPAILKELRRRGYTFVTVETLAKHLRTGKAAERKAMQERLAARKPRTE